MEKTRLVPVKPRMILRLELPAATTAVRLDTMIKQKLDVALDRSVFWTDSTSVLRYVNNEKKRFQTFVANRISVIRDASELNQWNYVSTKCNPADDAIRGLSADALLESNRWIKGPDFLWQNEDSWPEDVFCVGEVPSDDPEVRKEVQAYNVVNIAEQKDGVMNRLITRCSYWNKLKKSVAWLLRFKLWLQWKLRKKMEETELVKLFKTCKMTAKEMDMADNKLCTNGVIWRRYQIDKDQRYSKSLKLYMHV